MMSEEGDIPLFTQSSLSRASERADVLQKNFHPLHVGPEWNRQGKIFPDFQMNHPIQMKPADNENRQERKLFVGMISKKLNETDVRSIFQKFGVIDECTVLRHENKESRGCAFVTFASKECAQNAIKAVHHSTTMEGCNSPIVVKFADTQKDKDQKRQQQIQTTNIMGTISANTLAPINQPVISDFLSRLELQQQLQLQQAGYLSQLSPLGVQGLSGLNSLGSATTTGGLNALRSTSPTDLTWPSLGVNQQNALNLTLALNALSSSLTQTDYPYTYTGANGCPLGLANTVALTGSGLHTGYNSLSTVRTPQVAEKQQVGPEGANLFIYHLPVDYSDIDLAQMFVGFGNVISAKVFRDKTTGCSKCFGFVSYDSPASAQLAIQNMNGFQIGPKRLKVQHKGQKNSKPY